MSLFETGTLNLCVRVSCLLGFNSENPPTQQYLSKLWYSHPDTQLKCCSVTVRRKQVKFVGDKTKIKVRIRLGQASEVTERQEKSPAVKMRQEKSL